MPARVCGTVVAGVTMLVVAAVAVPAEGAPHLVPAPASAQNGARVASAHGDRNTARIAGTSSLGFGSRRSADTEAPSSSLTLEPL